MIKYISFDLDGTLADNRFDLIIWDEEIPRLYAERNHISLEEAKTKVFAEYYKALYIEKVQQWKDVAYWFKRLDLDDSWEDIIKSASKNISLYTNAINVLEYLSKRYKLLIISAADRKFLDLKIGSKDISKYFYKVFSLPTDMGFVKKSRSAFLKVLSDLNIDPEDIVHVGDDLYEDYHIPSSVGIMSFLLDRSGKSMEGNTITSLAKLKELL